MVRLSYTSRKIDGHKCAEIVAKNVRKERVKASSTSKSAKAVESGLLELEVNDKKLTDDDMLEIVQALVEVTRDDANSPPLKIQELILSRNLLTTSSLARLASVIHAAKFDIKVLDLSFNRIKVDTPEEAQQWEYFLQSFTHCYCLRRINLSGNNLSGAKAFEIFARVYASHTPVDPADPKHLAASVISLTESDTASLIDKTKNVSLEDQSNTSESKSETHLNPKPSLSSGLFLKRCRGLRSVPYLVFRDVSLTGAGALFLSYVLAHHYLPDQLMSGLNAGPIASQLDEYSQDSSLKGVIYLPNDLLNRAAKDLLESTELERTMLGGGDDGDAGSLDTVPETGAMPIGRKVSSSGPFTRRVSAMSAYSSEDSQISGVNSLRRKIQRSTIEESGANCVELWSSAIKMLAHSRSILHGTTANVRRSSPVDPSAEVAHPNTPQRRVSGASCSSPPSAPSVPHNTPAQSYAARVSVASPSITTEPILTITEATNGTKQPQPFNLKFVKPRKSKPMKLAQLSNLRTETAQADVAIERTSYYQQCLDIMSQRIVDLKLKQGGNGYRDTTLPKDLPMPLLQDILVRAAGAGVLTERQQQSVMAYAQNMETLAEECKMLGKPKSSQIWWALNEMDCLAYEIKL
ncbi:MAG: hypothetical protein M1820_000392 [Bogoriella megaspora]|nr:MAG: hypothetical protein M1820_000392 [Bogoriella megaspora]